MQLLLYRQEQQLKRIVSRARIPIIHPVSRPAHVLELGMRRMLKD
jgi:hypothetical protein